jgi:hypothetical protein
MVGRGKRRYLELFDPSRPEGSSAARDGLDLTRTHVDDLIKSFGLTGG